MQSFKLKAIRIVQLSQSMGAIQPKDLVVMDDIRINVGLTKDLDKANETLSEKVKSFEAEKAELLEPVKKEFDKASKEMTEEEKQTLRKELLAKFELDNKKFLEKNNKEVEKLGETELTIELSDEKYSNLKEWFEKYSIIQNINKIVIVEIRTALGIE